MTSGLSVDDVVKVTVNLSTTASSYRNFGVLLILGASDVIDVSERLRSYTAIESVAEDFGTTAPEYKAALLFFSQSPQPSQLMIGRWAKTATAPVLKGAILDDDAQALSVWRAVTAGEMTVSIGGESVALTGLDFSAVTNLNGVASIVNAGLTAAGAAASLNWDGSRFRLTATATGSAAALGYGSGTLAVMMALTSDTASALVAGADDETALACVTDLADISGAWYGLMIADGDIGDDDHLAVAAAVEAASRARIYGVTVTDSRALDSTYTADLASRLNDAGLSRSFALYCSTSDYAVASFFGRAFTVNFSGSKTTLTMKFKQLPDVSAETLTETQAATLKSKRCNVFVNYQNDTAIVQEGVMAASAYFDEVHGLDWLADRVQTDVWNLLYTSKTKIPQTDAGINRIVATIEAALGQAVTNGLLAPGTWNGDGFGQLAEGDYLPKGFYVYAQPIADQSQSERESRAAPAIQIAAKLAGAVHSVDVQIDVNR